MMFEETRYSSKNQQSRGAFTRRVNISSIRVFCRQPSAGLSRRATSELHPPEIRDENEDALTNEAKNTSRRQQRQKRKRSSAVEVAEAVARLRRGAGLESAEGEDSHWRRGLHAPRGPRHAPVRQGRSPTFDPKPGLCAPLPPNHRGCESGRPCSGRVRDESGVESTVLSHIRDARRREWLPLPHAVSLRNPSTRLGSGAASLCLPRIYTLCCWSFSPFRNNPVFLGFSRLYIIIMAAPAEKTIKDLNGDWVMNKELSGDFDSLLKLVRSLLR